MADTKISGLGSLTGASLATGDQLVAVDVSDTSMAASGTDKNITADELAKGLATTLGLVGRDKIFDAKGDLPVGTGADTAQKLAVGTDGQVLMATSGATTGLAWSFPIPVVKPTTSYWFPANAKAWSSFALTLNKCYYSPIWIPVAGTVDRIGLFIQAGAASATPRLGLYSSGSDGRPSALLVDGGTVDGSTNGEKTVTISQAVTPGLYWVAVVNQTAAATLYYYATSGTGAVVLGIGAHSSGGTSQDPQSIYTQASVSGALPSTPTLTNDQNPTAVYLRLS